MTFEYQKSRRFFVQVPRGLEKLARREIESLGAQGIRPGLGGFHVTLDWDALFRLNYRGRLLVRVLAPLITFDCHSDRYLYKTVQHLDWSKLLTLETTFAVSARLADSAITHSQFASRRVKDAIVDQFRDKCGLRPSVDPLAPDLWLHLHLRANRAVLYADTSGGSLHRRHGSRDDVVAPLNETLAAAMIRLSGWQGRTPFLDPFCGSGTLLQEALGLAAGLPAGLARHKFGIQRLPGFDPARWQEFLAGEEKNGRPLAAGLIRGSDIDAQAVAATKVHLAAWPQGGSIPVTVSDFRQLPPFPDGTIVTNPPYGVRLGGGNELPALYRDFGRFLREKCPGTRAWVLCGNPELPGHLGIAPRQEIPLFNGPIRCRLLELAP